MSLIIKWFLVKKCVLTWSSQPAHASKEKLQRRDGRWPISTGFAICHSERTELWLFHGLTDYDFDNIYPSQLLLHRVSFHLIVRSGGMISTRYYPNHVEVNIG